MYTYKINSVGDSSAKYGNCEVCGKHATEVFHQVETKQYTRPDGTQGFTRHNCHNIFGHEQCLVSKRK
jgi:ABC-type phosphate transport system auxiliary subunit